MEMTQRERIEDLGVLLEKLATLMDDDLFEVLERNSCRRPKDVCEAFEALTEDNRCDLLIEMAYGIERVSNEISECWSIARGSDTDE
jgi:hypothetical protein